MLDSFESIILGGPVIMPLLIFLQFFYIYLRVKFHEDVLCGRLCMNQVSLLFLTLL